MADSKLLQKVLRASRNQTRKLYTPDYRLTRQRTLKVLPGTRTFYVEAKKFLDSAGFRRLGDYRITSMPRGTPANLTPLRIYLSPDGETVADAFYYQAPLKQHIRSALHGMAMPLTYDFTTEFEDGGFLATSNAEAASMIALPKSIQSIFLKAYTPAGQILQAHRRELAKQKKLGRKPVRVTNQAGMIASATRMHVLKSEFRQAAGGLQMKEVKAIKRRNEDAAEAMLKAIAKLFGPDHKPGTLEKVEM